MKNPAAAPTLEHNDDVSWFGMAAAPFAAAMQQVGNYALVPIACHRGLHWPLYLLSLLALALALAGGATAARDWLRHNGALESAEMPSRSRFIALMAMAWSALLVLLIVAQAVAQFYFDPCQR